MHNQCILLISFPAVYWTWGSINIHYAEQRNAFNWTIRTKQNLKIAFRGKFQANVFDFCPNCSPRRHTVAILRPMAMLPQMSLGNGTWSSPRWLIGLSIVRRLANLVPPEKSSGKTGLLRLEKVLLSHGVSRGGAHQCPHAASQGIICTSVSTTLCQSKNQQKRILSHEKLTGLMTMLCTAYLMVVVVSKLKFTD